MKMLKIGDTELYIFKFSQARVVIIIKSFKHYIAPSLPVNLTRTGTICSDSFHPFHKTFTHLGSALCPQNVYGGNINQQTEP